MRLYSNFSLILIVKDRRFVELLITYLLKSLKEVVMMKELISGLLEFYYMSWQVEQPHLRQKIKISHMKKFLKVNALIHNFLVMN